MDAKIIANTINQVDAILGELEGAFASALSAFADGDVWLDDSSLRFGEAAEEEPMFSAVICGLNCDDDDLPVAEAIDAAEKTLRELFRVAYPCAEYDVGALDGGRIYLEIR